MRTLATLALLLPSATMGGTRGCCAPERKVLFCEDFEQLPTGGASSMVWGIDTRNGTLTAERRTHEGQVLHARTRDNGRAFLIVDNLTVHGASGLRHPRRRPPRRAPSFNDAR